MNQHDDHHPSSCLFVIHSCILGTFRYGANRLLIWYSTRVADEKENIDNNATGGAVIILDPRRQQQCCATTQTFCF